MKSRKLTVILFSTFIFLCCVAVGSAAYLTHFVSNANRFTVGYNEISIEENWNPPIAYQANTIYTKKVEVKNTGKVPCYVRVYVAQSDQDIPIECDFDTTDWTKSSDGYYYYNKIVQPNKSTTALFNDVTIGDVQSDKLKDFDIYVYAESVQSAGATSATSAFNNLK